MRPGSMPCAVGLTSAVLLAGAWTVSCGGASPATPIPVAPAPTPVSATPLPTPTPATVAQRTCPMGPGSMDAVCGKSSPRLLANVEAAIDTLVRERPDLFNLQEEAGSGGYRVLNTDAYLDGVVERLRRSGHCAERTFDLERVLVKSSNDRSEEWDIVTSTRFIRRNASAYRSSCSPASFPIEPADLLHRVSTYIWAYECGPEAAPPAVGSDTLRIGCDGRVTATPKMRDDRPMPARLHGTEVRWELREGEDVVMLVEDRRFPDPFNRVLIANGRLGSFKVCATVLGKEGCLDGRTMP